MEKLNLKALKQNNILVRTDALDMVQIKNVLTNKDLILTQNELFDLRLVLNEFVKVLNPENTPPPDTF